MVNPAPPRDCVLLVEVDQGAEVVLVSFPESVEILLPNRAVRPHELRRPTGGRATVLDRPNVSRETGPAAVAVYERVNKSEVTVHRSQLAADRERF